MKKRKAEHEHMQSAEHRASQATGTQGSAMLELLAQAEADIAAGRLEVQSEVFASLRSEYTRRGTDS